MGFKPSCAEGPFYLGIDVGSVSVKVILLDRGGDIRKELYRRGKGQPLGVLLQMLEEVLEEVDLRNIVGVGSTGSGGKCLESLLSARSVNEIIALAKANEWIYPQVRSLIEMGGEDSKLILLNYDPASGGTLIHDFSMNAICAAGTGSFLDQQASRLGLAIEEEFGALALQSQNPPRIAGRCTVFAKSDMIHLQQIGTPLADIVAGLCYAVARNFKSTLAKGKRLEPPISFQGGVAANVGMVRAFQEVMEPGEGELFVPPHHASMGAIGAALWVRERGEVLRELFSLQALREYLAGHRGSAQILSRGAPPYDIAPAGYSEHRARVASSLLEANKRVGAYLGIDVGSVSTNVVAIDQEGQLLARRYLRTAGRPLEAVRCGLQEIGEEVGSSLEVLGVGTTGSGRYLTADYVGADLVRNEITAQATAALQFDPQVDTIFEIGGQDSKYIGLESEIVVDFEMNKVCAAGTGSFLEEQAEKLGVDIIGEFGSLALKSNKPAQLGDRCTVFIESDLVSCQNKGAGLEELLAGLSTSIVQNYLHLVVGERKIGKRIFFQGGVAANRAVVRAFERVLGQKVIVPPHHDVTGAIGAALLARQALPEGPSRFKGFDLSSRTYSVETFTCQGCENLCEINRIRFEDEKKHAFYGARCERYEINQTGRTAAPSIPNLIQERESLLLAPLKEQGQVSPDEGQEGPGARGQGLWGGILCPSPLASCLSPHYRIGIPRALFFYEYLPFWGAFFRYLDCEVVLSEPTNQGLTNLAAENAVAEACFPIKIAFGHVLSLLEKGVDFLFFPSLLTYPPENSGSSDRMGQTCPYISTVPYLTEAALDEKGRTKLLRPILEFRWGRKYWERSLIAMGKQLGRPPKAIREAITKAEEAQVLFYRGLRLKGQEVLNRLSPGEKAIVLISRPYNGCDSGLNLGLVQKLKKMGVLTIPLDLLPLDEVDISDLGYNIYWRYGQKILKAARYIRTHGRNILYPLYITNFGCGPDSFLMGFFKSEMGGYPCLQIEVDEHHADAGLVTRCEAFLDSISGYRGKRSGARNIPKPLDRKPLRPIPSASGSFDKEMIIPYMSDVSYGLAAAFKALGIEAQVLPESDGESLELGKRFSLGKECLPFVLTLGDFLKVLRRDGFDPGRSAFFMPSADGPCRFGMYHQRQKQIFNQLGYGGITFISPNQGNTNGYFNELNKFPPRFSRLAWQSIVAFELLEKVYRSVRPYALRQEDADAAYREMLQELTRGIIAGRLEMALGEVLDRLGSVSTQDREGKPIIGIVGEIYLRSHRFSNHYLVRTIEELGGEARVATTQEWILFVNHWLQKDSWRRRDLRGFLKAYLKEKVQRRDEHRLHQMGQRHLRDGKEPPVERLMHYCGQYLHPQCGTEAVLSLGKAVDFIHEGVSGIISVMPFTCMPGTVVSALLKRLQEDHHHIPCLSLAYDGLEDTSVRTRLEAFIHQAQQFRNRRS